jgi:hypothetical protein
MMDILLTADGDLLIDDSGDITLTTSTRQAVRVRLLWYLREWRFWPDTGIPYYEDIFVKKPNLENVRRIIRDEVAVVDGVVDVRDITVTVNAPARRAAVSLTIETAEETYREEVAIDVRLRGDA